MPAPELRTAAQFTSEQLPQECPSSRPPGPAGKDRHARSPLVAGALASKWCHERPQQTPQAALQLEPRERVEPPEAPATRLDGLELGEE